MTPSRRCGPSDGSARPLGVRCSPRTARPTHGVGSARGGRSLVAGRAASGCRAHGACPRTGAGLCWSGTAYSPGGGRCRRRRRRILRGLPRPASPRGGGPDPARILRRRPGSGAVRLAGALDRLRAVRDGEEGSAATAVYVLAAADPANPYGAASPWPRRGDGDRRPLQRAAGAYVVLVDGIAALYLERGGSSLQTLPAADDPNIVLTALRGLTTSSPVAASASSSSARSTASPSASRHGVIDCSRSVSPRAIAG